MKLLLDENLPDSLKKHLKNHEVSTVKDESWESYQNGELLQRMVAAKFEALITLDRNLQYQQNLNKYSIPIVILRITRRQRESLHAFAPLINQLLKGRLKPGPHELTLN